MKFAGLRDELVNLPVALFTVKPRREIILCLALGVDCFFQDVQRVHKAIVCVCVFFFQKHVKRIQTNCELFNWIPIPPQMRGCVLAGSNVINGFKFANSIEEKIRSPSYKKIYLISTALLNSRWNPPSLIIQYKHSPPKGDNRSYAKWKKFRPLIDELWISAAVFPPVSVCRTRKYHYHPKDKVRGPF